jgi:hypothetical protein
MSVAAEAAVRAWVNGQAQLTGEGRPLSGGAYLGQQRSPASGIYAVLARSSQAAQQVVAEGPGDIDVARISAMVYGGTQEAAEAAAAALASAVEALSGSPQRAGDTGVLLLVSANLSGPMYVPMPSAGGEEFAFEVAADFMLTKEAAA